MTETNRKADLRSLVAAVAASPIIVSAPKARDFADWCRRQHGADVDSVILEWLRSHAPRPAALS